MLRGSGRDFADPVQFDTLLGELESYYIPSWSVYDAVCDSAEDRTLVCDFGCGTGHLARRLLDRRAVAGYVGHDRDRARITYAQRLAPSVVFTGDSDEFVRLGSAAESALFVVAFCLHDQPTVFEVLELIDRMRPAAIVAWDLSCEDLPALSRLLRSRADRVMDDPRTRIVEFAEMLRDTGREVSVRRQAHDVVFPTASAVLDYVNAFDLLGGADLGASFGNPASVRRTILGLPTPFHDHRRFVEVYAR